MTSLSNVQSCRLPVIKAQKLRSSRNGRFITELNIRVGFARVQRPHFSLVTVLSNSESTRGDSGGLHFADHGNGYLQWGTLPLQIVISALVSKCLSTDIQALKADLEPCSDS